MEDDDDDGQLPDDQEAAQFGWFNDLYILDTGIIFLKRTCAFSLKLIVCINNNFNISHQRNAHRKVEFIFQPLIPGQVQCR